MEQDWTGKIESDPASHHKHSAIFNGDANGMTVSTNRDINSHGVPTVAPLLEQKKEEEGVAEDVKVNLFPEGEEPVGRGWQGASGLKYEITKKCGSWLVSV